MLLKLLLEVLEPLLDGVGAEALVVVVAVGVGGLLEVIEVLGVLDLAAAELAENGADAHVVLARFGIDVGGVQAGPYSLLPLSEPVLLHLTQKLLHHVGRDGVRVRVTVTVTVTVRCG